MVFLMGKIPKLRFQIPNSKIKKSKIPKSRLQNPQSPRKNKTVPRKCVLLFLFFIFSRAFCVCLFFWMCLLVFSHVLLNYLLILFFFIFCLFRCNAKKRREFPIDCSSPCGKAGLDPSIVSFLLFCVLYLGGGQIKPWSPDSGSKMMFVGCQLVFAYFAGGWNHSRPQPWGIWSSRLGVAKGFIWF